MSLLAVAAAVGLDVAFGTDFERVWKFGFCFAAICASTGRHDGLIDERVLEHYPVASRYGLRLDRYMRVRA